jgi:hypothetical protein
VVANGAFSIASRINTTPRSAEDRQTMRIAAATMTIGSVISVVAALSALQSIRKAEPQASRKTDPQLSPVNPISQATAAEPRASAESPTRGVATVAVRMQQTGRSTSDCVGYLQRPSGLCDGGQ